MLVLAAHAVEEHLLCLDQRVGEFPLEEHHDLNFHDHNFLLEEQLHLLFGVWLEPEEQLHLCWRVTATGGATSFTCWTVTATGGATSFTFWSVTPTGGASSLGMPEKEAKIYYRELGLRITRKAGNYGALTFKNDGMHACDITCNSYFMFLI